jgi:hypothetical protein
MAVISIIREVLLTIKRGVVVPELKVELAAKEYKTVEIYLNCGLQSMPVVGDYAILERRPESGVMAAVGFLDQKNRINNNVDPGTSIIYSRDVDGNILAVSHLDKNGDIVSYTDTVKTIIGSSGASSATDKAQILINDNLIVDVSESLVTINANVDINGNLQVDGTIDAAQQIASDTKVEAPIVEGTTNVVFDGISGNSHAHGGVETGTGTSGGPV